MIPFLRGRALPSFIALIAFGYIVGIVVHTVLVGEAERAKAAAHDAAVARAQARIVTQIEDIGTVSATDVAQGFWISYTDESGSTGLFYVDPQVLAENGLSDADLADLLAKIRASEVIHHASGQDLPDAALPASLQFHNALYASPLAGTSTLDTARALQKKIETGDATSQDLFEMSYLKELQGDYAARDALNAKNCAEFRARCGTTQTVTLRGTVVDRSGQAIQGATVSVVSSSSAKPVRTGPDGKYVIAVKVSPIEKLRVRAAKRNFSDGYADTIVLDTPGKSAYALDPIRLEAPIDIVTIDYAHHTVTGEGNTFSPDGTVTLHTQQSTYRIPKDAIRDHGAPYRGTVDVYLYEFSKGNPPESLMHLDTFDQVMGYAGNLMKSFGMPYIQFFTPDGEELDVLSSNPMVLTYRIVNMQELRDDSDHIYRPLTDADMQSLVSASAAAPYRIDRQFLIDHQLLQFPAFWVFDRHRGIWDNVGISVLNTQGTIQSTFYTIRDDI